MSLPIHGLLLVATSLASFGSSAAWAQATVGAAPTTGTTISLTSLDWPPYTDQTMPNQGTTTALVRAALAKAGYQLEVAFYPWNRTVALTKTRSRFAGYFPEYFSPKIAQDCLLSRAIGSGPLGMAQLKSRPVHWTSLDDLAGLRIGIVQGYVNSQEFDERVAQGRLTVDVARDDSQNLHKLLAGRVALAVVDQRVLDFLLQSDPVLRPHRDKIGFNQRLLEDKLLYICFRRNPEGERARDLVNEGLKRLEAANEPAVE